MRAAMFLVRYGHMSLREVLDLKTDVLHLAAEKLGQLLREELDTSPVREVFRPDGVDPAYLGPAAQRYEAEASARLSGRACIVVVSPDGQPVHDVVVGRPITLRNDDNSGVRAWRWTLLSKPEGSTALENPTSSKVNFAPDVAGTYVVRLQVNGAELASMRSEVQLHVVAATPAPEMVIAEADGGRSITLRGRTLPFADSNSTKFAYPGDAGVTVFEGQWDALWMTDKAHAPILLGFGPDTFESGTDATPPIMATAFLSLLRKARPLKVTFGATTRYGLLREFEPSFVSGTRIGWRAKFCWSTDTATAPQVRGARVQVGVAEVDRWRASRREQIQQTAEAIKSTLRPTPTDPPSETTISFRELAQRNAERVELQRIHDLVHERRLRLQVESDDHVSYVDVIRGLINDAHVPSVDARDLADLRTRAEKAEAALKTALADYNEAVRECNEATARAEKAEGRIADFVAADKDDHILRG